MNDDNLDAHVNSPMGEQDSGEGPHLRFVGVAASAGGLEAVSLLAKNLPQDANAVYIVAQHMSPTHKSVLSSLISRETSLPVGELEPETKPKPNHIYVTPPNTDVVYENGLLRLRNPAGHPASPKPSADRLFKSLAEHCGESCLGIVLSGTGGDGSYGVQAIREVGGITIAQEPSSAKYDGMPTSAIETGCIDLTLTPDQIGMHLEKILAQPRNFEAFRSLVEQPNPMGELYGILLARTQVDFADYKQNTLTRRIARRMTALGIEEYDSYVDYCRTHVNEVDALHRDLLISVTRFFRDPEQFEKLQVKLERTVSERRSGPIRVWVVGCATGEEAYSIAIVLATILGGISHLARRNVQIFATDIDQNAINVARKGVYPISAAQDIPEKYLSEYFIVGDGEITVRPELRAVTLFSHHNVFQDPPFVNVDLVSIRNVMIYFNRAMQERVLSRLHYAMSASGMLFLGTSESVGEMGIFFEGREGADKIFGKRRGISGELSIDPGARIYNTSRGSRAGNSAASVNKDLAAQSERSLASAVAPNGMICTNNGNIIEVLGDISQYMQIRAGVANSLNVKMLIDPLKTEATSLISVALRRDQKREGRWHEVSLPVGNRVQLQAFPFVTQPGGERQCLVAINSKFEEQSEVQSVNIADKEQRDYVERIEHEIKATQEALQQTIEELQTANEELQSSNEELQSTNEEFQATNEELETSNEELQSTNEELLTVNEELQISSSERQALTSELEATMITAPYSVALADQALMIRRLSKVALELFGLSKLPSSGVHLSQCDLPSGFPALAPIANTVLRLQETRRIPILSEGKYYSMVMSPVHDLHKRLIGISITVTQYDNEPIARVLEMMGEVTKVAHWTFNLDTEKLFWSPEMFDIYHRDPSGEMPTWEEANNLIHPEDREHEMLLFKVLVENGGTHHSDKRIFGKDGRIISVRGSTMLVCDSSGKPVQLIGVLWDSQEQTENAIQLEHLEDVQNMLGIGFFSYDVENNEQRWNDTAYEILGFEKHTHVASVENLIKAVFEDDRDQAAKAFQDALENGRPFEFNARLVNAGDQCFTFTGKARRRSKGHVSHVFGSILKCPTPIQIEGQ